MKKQKKPLIDDELQNTISKMFNSDEYAKLINKVFWLKFLISVSGITIILLFFIPYWFKKLNNELNNFMKKFDWTQIYQTVYATTDFISQLAFKKFVIRNFAGTDNRKIRKMLRKQKYELFDPNKLVDCMLVFTNKNFNFNFFISSPYRIYYTQKGKNNWQRHTLIYKKLIVYIDENTNKYSGLVIRNYGSIDSDTESILFNKHYHLDWSNVAADVIKVLDPDIIIWLSNLPVYSERIEIRFFASEIQVMMVQDLENQSNFQIGRLGYLMSKNKVCKRILFKANNDIENFYQMLSFVDNWIYQFKPIQISNIL